MGKGDGKSGSREERRFRLTSRSGSRCGSGYLDGDGRVSCKGEGSICVGLRQGKKETMKDNGTWMGSAVLGRWRDEGDGDREWSRVRVASRRG